MSEDEEKYAKKEPEETEENPAPMGAIYTDSGGTTHISTGTGKWTPVPSTITSGSITGKTFASGGMVVPTPAASKPPATVLAGPTKRPRKLLVAFLGDDDEVEWCAKVNPHDIDLSFDKDEPAPRMELGFWLIDAG